MAIKLLRENHNTLEELANDAAGVILAGSEDWLDGDHEYGFEYDCISDETVMLKFIIDGETIGFWDIDKADIDDVNVLDEISAEVEAAVSGMDITKECKAVKEAVSTSGVYKFHADDQIKKEVPQCMNYEGKNAVITDTDIEATDNKFATGFYSIQFEDGFTLSALSGKCLKKVADKPLKESNTKLKLKAGDTFENAGITWKVLDQNEEDTVIVALDENGEPTDRYVVAWGLQPDGSWNQGHYFQNKKDAMKHYEKRAKKTESFTKDEFIKNTKYCTNKYDIYSLKNNKQNYFVMKKNEKPWETKELIQTDIDGITHLDKLKLKESKIVVASGLQDDGSWNPGHYFQIKDAALNKFRSRGKLTESVITEDNDDSKLYGYDVTKFDKLPPFKSGLWIRLTRKDKYEAEYYTFVNDARAKECYKEIVSGVVDPQDISDICLGFTASDDSEQIRWQDYADNFTPYIAPDKKLESNKITEDKELTEDPSDDLEKIGYKQIRNADGEILYRSDVLYSPEISVFGSIINVIPLTELPIQMTVEDHGKMVARLAQVQKVLEDLR